MQGDEISIVDKPAEAPEYRRAKEPKSPRFDFDHPEGSFSLFPRQCSSSIGNDKFPATKTG
jgi:hypothetical protein